MAKKRRKNTVCFIAWAQNTRDIRVYFMVG